jgi:hypothetical protein
MSTATSTTTRLLLCDFEIKYRKILVPHDGLEMSDKALSHAAYLSKTSGGEIVVLNVIEHEIIPPNTLLAFIKPETSLDKAKQGLRNTLEGGIKQMLGERIRQCKNAGINKIS